MLPFSIPLGLNSTVLSQLTEATGFVDDIVYGNSEHTNNHQCRHIAASPTSLDWTHAYKEYPSTVIMMCAFTKTKNPVWSVDTLHKVELEYYSSLIAATISLLYDKLVLYKPVHRNKKYITLIIVPRSLHRKIFSHFHVSPSGGNMGGYKTLFRIRMRFYWPGICKDIQLWVK